MTKKNRISEVSTENSFIDDLKKYFPPELYEKYTQPGVLKKICKSYFTIKLPAGTHLDNYWALCKVHEVAYKLDKENPTMTITAMAKHPEIEAVIREHNISLDMRAKHDWISRVVKRTKGRPKKK
jgi:hypothetical protein